MFLQGRQLSESPSTNRTLQRQRQQSPAIIPSLLRHINFSFVFKFGDYLRDGDKEIGVESVPLGISQDWTIEILINHM